MTERNPRDAKGRGLVILGMLLLAAGGLCLRFHLDFFAGVGLGAGMTCLVIWLLRYRR